MKLVIDKRCFKIDRPNAYAMISGYLKKEKINRQSIWCAVADGPFPMLITLNRSPTPFIVSEPFRHKNLNEFNIPYRYIAILDLEYFIKNDIRLWQRVCTNGLFDIWDPRAPFSRFADCKSQPGKFRIQLLRVFEIEEEFLNQDIIAVSSRVDHLLAPNKTVTIKKPVVADEDFFYIKELLKQAVKGFVT